MRNALTLVAALALAFPLAAHAQGLPLPSPGESSGASDRVTFTFFSPGILPGLGVLEVDLTTGQVTLSPQGQSAAQEETLPADTLAAVRAAAQSVLAGEPPAAASAPAASAQDPWSTVIVIGSQVKVEVSTEPGLALQRFGEQMLSVAREIQDAQSPPVPAPVVEPPPPVPVPAPIVEPPPAVSAPAIQPPPVVAVPAARPLAEADAPEAEDAEEAPEPEDVEEAPEPEEAEEVLADEPEETEEALVEEIEDDAEEPETEDAPADEPIVVVEYPAFEPYLPLPGPVIGPVVTGPAPMPSEAPWVGPVEAPRRTGSLIGGIDFLGR